MSIEKNGIINTVTKFIFNILYWLLRILVSKFVISQLLYVIIWLIDFKF